MNTVAETPDILTRYVRLAEMVEARVQQTKTYAAELLEKSIDAKAAVQQLEAEYADINTKIEQAAQSVIDNNDVTLFNQLKARRRDLPMLISAAKIRLHEIEFEIENSIYLSYQELIQEVRNENKAIQDSEKAFEKAKVHTRNVIEGVTSMVSWYRDRKRVAENKLYMERQNLTNMK